MRGYFYCHDLTLLFTLRIKYRMIRYFLEFSMAGNDSSRYWDPLVMHQQLTQEEKQLRDRFVTEYLKDMDGWAAACRVGYVRSVAHDYASYLLQEPYVQQEIDRRRSELPTDPKLARKHNEHKVEQLLWECAQYKGPGASHSARVAAAAKLCNIYDMDGTTKVKSEITHKGGVMLVPAIASVEDWEKQAAKTQDALIASSSEDRTNKPLH